MSMVIAHNMMAYNAERQTAIENKKKTKTTEKLSSGYKINRAADDAAGLEISEKMRLQIRGLNQGTDNTQDGVSWVQVGDGSLNEIQDMIHRISELAIQAANGTLSESDRDDINNEVQQLKQEIDQTARRTKFNDIPIFDCEAREVEDLASMSVTGGARDMDVFDASYDKASGEIKWGGITFRGTRVSWDTINPGMVYEDGGVQKFHAGDYSYTMPNGTSFFIHCEEGDTVPKFTRTVSLGADADGVYVDGEKVEWSSLVDETGEECSDKNVHGGIWTMDYYGATVSFNIFRDVSSLGGMAAAINDLNLPLTTYTWKADVKDERTEEPAVQLGSFNVLKISNSFLINNITIDAGESPLDCAKKAEGAIGQQADTVDRSHVVVTGTNPDGKVTSAKANHPDGIQGKFSGVYIRAGQDPFGSGKNGIWLADGNTASATNFAGSFQSWEDMGINDWFNGPDIPGDINYAYKQDDETVVAFKYSLSKVTSEDSVINGLDGIRLGGEIETHYGAVATVDDPDKLAKDFGFTGIRTKSDVDLTFKEEQALIRNYDEKIDTLQQKGDMVLTASGDVNAEFNDTSANTVTNLKGNVNVPALANSLKAKSMAALDYVDAYITAGVIAGTKQENMNITWTKDLRVLLGEDNVTSDEYLSEALDLAGVDYDTGRIDQTGKKLASAHIDFQKVGTLGLDALDLTGFNSTCMTCNNHYSVEFRKDMSGYSTTTSANGYQYAMISSAGNYQLEIDLDSLRAKGVRTGADLAKALAEITDECFDFHYTQYAAKGSNFYIYDERPEVLGGTEAEFSTKPYINPYEEQFSIKLGNDDGDSVDMDYSFDMRAISNRIKVEMKQVSSGSRDSSETYYTWVDPSDHNKGYKVFAGDDAEWGNAVLANNIFTLEKTYLNKDGNAITDTGGNLITDMNSAKAAAVDQYTSDLVKESINSTIIGFKSTDYTYGRINNVLNSNGDPYVANRKEEGNVAFGVDYDSYVDVKHHFYRQKRIRIQHSSQVDHHTDIPVFPMNTHVMGINTCNTKTVDDALYTIDATNYANKYVSMKRSVFGALQNRLEHTLNSNRNTAENTQAAESVIRDADMASEMVNYSIQNVLSQTGQAMLAQANQMNQGILSLLK